MISPRFRGLRVHLVGIGGAGVGALVPLLVRAGAVVSGCDSHDGPELERLRALGIPCAIGHHPAHIHDVDLVVHTAAVGPDLAELAEARRRGIAVVTRGACLVYLMEGSRTIAISGSHGKTSTTWMAGHLLEQAGLDPIVMVGGSVAALGHGGARAGGGELFVAETDESDGSFALVEPELAVVTNLDHEHLRHYGGSFTALEDAFHAWLARIPAHGAAVVPAQGLAPRLTAGLACQVVTCGLESGDWRAGHLELGPEGSRLRVLHHGRDQGQITVGIPGTHMALNALMACAVARLAAPGIDLAKLSTCERVRRRFTVHGAPAGIRVVEDYGHHPTEVRATIAAARLGGGRVHVAFQPHRYSRTADCFDAFVAAFDQAHRVAVLPIYAASEAPIPGVSAADLAAAIAARRCGDGSARACADRAEALAHLGADLVPGDTLLVLGAGDIGRLAGEAIRHLTSAEVAA